MSDDREPSCDALAEALSLLASGALPDREKAAVVEHLGRCPACHRSFVERQQLAASLTPSEDLAWLDSASAGVLRRVAAELEVSSTTRLNHREETSLRGVRQRGGLTRQRGWFWLASGAMAAAAAWLALSGWRTGVDDLTPAPTGGSGMTAKARPTADSVETEQRAERLSEFPTWWELQRSWAESEEAFERALARGSAGGFSQAREISPFIQEWDQ
jgi:anti-sigma factor RsiW